jgi:hypothetical protein
MSAARADRDASPESTPATPTDAPDPRIGGEVEAGSGRLPGFFRWLNIGLYVAAIMYLILNRVEGYAILLVLAVALAAWTIYFATQKKPPEP